MRWTVLQLRSRRGLLAALLVALVALFAARVVVHHVAEDASPAAAIGHHESDDHGLALDLVAAASGFLLLGAFVAGANRAGRPSGLRFAVARQVRSREPSPRWRPPRTPRRAELQSYLT